VTFSSEDMRLHSSFAEAYHQSYNAPALAVQVGAICSAFTLATIRPACKPTSTTAGAGVQSGSMALCPTASLFAKPRRLEAGRLLSAKPALWKPKPQADPLENAFVLRVAPSSDFETGKLEGRVLHVESGRELEFRSVKEMVMFVSECMTHKRGKGPGR